jgi:hypothetical protein
MKKIIISLSIFAITAISASGYSLDTYEQREMWKGNCNAGSTYEQREVCKGNSNAGSTYEIREAAKGNCDALGSYQAREGCKSCSNKSRWTAIYITGTTVSCR